MQDLFKDAAVEVAELLKRFSFDLNELTAEQLAFTWLAQYPANWVHLSLVEALYQGRYKAISVEQILRFWHRRGQPFYHFNHEFERIIRGRFSRNLLTRSASASLNTQTRDRSNPHAERDVNLHTLSSESTEAIKDSASELAGELASELASEMGKSTQLPVSELPASESPEWENFSIISTATPSSNEAAADLLEFADVASDSVTGGAIQPFSDRLKLLSSEESIAFLKLRSFENGTPLYSLPKDAPIQAFRPISEFTTLNKLKWVKLAIDKSPNDPSSRDPLSGDLSSGDLSSGDLHSREQIHQFTPVAVSPVDFYSKLKAVAIESSRTEAIDSSSEGESDA